MQFHHLGYVSGDPRIAASTRVGAESAEEIPELVDVLIVGTGPAGMITAAQLSQFTGITTCIIERRAGRLEIGQADGIQSRTMETFQAFGFADRITSEAYRIVDTAFWKPDPTDPSRIVRTARVLDDPDSMSEFPHLVVNQARVLDYFAEVMAQSPTRLTPNYSTEFRNLEVTSAEDFPIAVTVSAPDSSGTERERTIHARYVVGADGAHSKVRESIGVVLDGDKANHAWGVMDVLAITDFPDIRTKCAIQSGAGGNLLLIPREGGYLFRMYVDLGEVHPDSARAVRATSVEEIIATANEIMAPYRIDVKQVAWKSVYEVGHRLADRFDDVPLHLVGRQAPRVFITGDACHTHSAKAAQGMNVSMQDGFNLGWKLAHVLEGLMPASVLSTYSAERKVVAKNLIDFDKLWSSLMAARPEDLKDPSELEEFYRSNAEFAAGFQTEYAPSVLIDGTSRGELAAGFPLGKRFKSAMVTRVCDANPVQVGHAAEADGRWRLYVFADRPRPGEPSATEAWARWVVNSADSPLFGSPLRGDGTSWFDIKVIYQQERTQIDLGFVPRAFLQTRGPFELVDYEKVFAIDPNEDIFDSRGIDRGGVVVVVRPDQYVANVVALDDMESLTRFFESIFLAS